VIVARDAAHRRLSDALADGKGLPFDPVGAAIYYAGPAPARPGTLIGPMGPTTSGRMDVFAPELYRMGIRATIGKGRRSPEVFRAIQETRGVYLGATGGAAALLARRVRAVRILAYADLGPEAILELTVAGFPLVVLIDPLGGDLYEIGPRRCRCAAERAPGDRG
jgi:fumarate hydratase subunit beta